MPRAPGLEWCAFLVLCATAWAQHRVSLPVLVRDEQNRPVTDLTAEELTLIDNGVRRPVTRAEAVTPPRRLITERPPAGYFVSNRPLAAFGSTQPVVVLLIDWLHTAVRQRAWMLYQCGRYVSLLRPGEDIAIYEVNEGGVRLRHQFTHDAAHLLESIAPHAFGYDAQGGRLTLVNRAALEQAAARAAGPERTRDDGDAVAPLFAHLAGIASRRNVLWVSGSFPRLARPAALAGSGVAVYPVEVQSGVAADPFLAVQPDGNGTLSDTDVKAMAQMAALTGGKAIRNRSQLAEAMFDAMEETRFAYQVEFDVPEAEWNGAAHRLAWSARRKQLTITAPQQYLAGVSEIIRDAPGFDKTDIGISVKWDSGQVLVARGDLHWKDAKGEQEADVEWWVSDEGERKPVRLRVSANREQGEPVVIGTLARPSGSTHLRDTATGRTGSLTVAPF